MRRRTESDGTPRDLQMTPEEKEALRELMETPGIEKEWDFFEDLKMDAPPPEFFMRGEPERPFKRLRKVGVICACVVLFFGSSVFLATQMIPSEAAADHSPLQIIVENIKNGFLTTKRGTGENDEIASLDTVIEDEELAMKKGKELFPELLLPSYIPEGFSFQRLKFSQNEQGDITAAFRYIDTEGNLLQIREKSVSSEMDVSFDNSIEGVEKEGEDILFFKQDEIYGENILTVRKGEQFKIYLSSEAVNEEELRAIYHGLE